MFRKRIVLTVLVIIMALVFSLSSRSMPQAQSSSAKGEPGFGLRLPPFMNVAHAAPQAQTTIADYFADGVAGISAYTNLGKEIDVDKLAKSSIFDVIEDSQAGEYVIGVITPTGFKDSRVQEYMQVHVFIEREGWIVAYLTPDQTVGDIIDWSTYTTEKLNTTSLENAIQQVARNVGTSVSDVSYFHFRYPNATNLMLIGDSLEREGNDSFSIKFPPEITIFESALSSAVNDGYIECSLNDDKITDHNSFGDWTLWRENISSSKWLANSPNWISIRASNMHSGDSAFCGVVLIYGAAE